MSEKNTIIVLPDVLVESFVDKTLNRICSLVRIAIFCLQVDPKCGRVRMADSLRAKTPMTFGNETLEVLLKYLKGEGKHWVDSINPLKEDDEDKIAIKEIAKSVGDELAQRKEERAKKAAERAATKAAEKAAKKTAETAETAEETVEYWLAEVARLTEELRAAKRRLAELKAELK